MSDDTDIRVMGARELGEALSITARRVRQLDEDGRIIRIAPGKYFFPQAFAAYLALQTIDRKRRARVDVLTLTCAGWLLLSDQVGAQEMKLWDGLAKRLDYSKHDAAAALANAVRILGNRAPEFT